MRKKFKKRFKSIIKLSNFIWKNLKIADNKSMSCMMHKSKSSDGKKTYYNLSGWREPEPGRGD